MAIGIYEQYKGRLLKTKPNVYLNGTCVDRSDGKEGPERDLADWIKGGTYVMKQCHNVANDPDYADVCITTSHVTGGKINRCTHVHHSQEGLLKRQLMTHLIYHHVGGCMQRCTGTNAMNALFSVIYDYDQTRGIGYHQRLLNYIEYCQEYGPICNCTQIDVKGSRNPEYKRAYMQPDPDSFVHMVDMGVDGIGVDEKPCKDIIAHGAKIRNSNTPYVDEIIINPTKPMGSDDADYTVAFAPLGDWDDVKFMVLPGLHHKRTHLETPFIKIGDVENPTIFDDCFVPYDHISICGRDNEGVPRYAGYSALMFAHYHHHSYIGCRTAVSKVITSQAALIADVDDVVREPHVREKLCDIIQTAELVFAAGEASAYHATQSPSRQRVPDEVPINAGRRLAGHNIHRKYETLADLIGGVCAPLPTEGSFFAPKTTELCSKYIRRNPAYGAEDIHRVMRMMENELCDSYETAQAVAGVHGGGSPPVETIAMMSRYDLEELKKITEYLTDIPGYGECLRYGRSAHTVTPWATLVEFGAMATAKKETKQKSEQNAAGEAR